VPRAGPALRSRTVNARLVRELALILEQPAETVEKRLDARLAGSRSVPPVSELVELGARARASRASVEELRLAVGALLALYAEPAEAAEP
jgi:hypothetical protein